MVIFSLLVGQSLYSQSSGGQLYLDHDTYVDLESAAIIEVDNSFFRPFVGANSDLYGDVNRYLYSPVSTKRRGVEWWHRQRTQGGDYSVVKDLEQPTRGRTLKLFSSTSNYRVGASVGWSEALRGGWGVVGSIYGCTGRDMSVEGVFRQELTSSVTLSKDFAYNHYLSISASVPYQMRGLRSSATQEAYDLTHNNLYNPAWGFYHGEVRNSRVVRNLLPTLSTRYQRTITSTTTASIELDATYGTRRLSRLGWYDANNPSPNYYSKLPSNYLGSVVYGDVMDVWQQNNTDYTQIAWDKLELINSASIDGSSHYVVEDQVERVADIDVRLLFEMALDAGFTISYGGNLNLYNHRNYKQMRDLLGGDYLLDIDQYAGDYVQVGNELQNNLRDPNRKIVEGDRFGYDYSHHRTLIQALVRAKYHTSLLDAQLSVAIGDESIYRDGHYEKERFPDEGSYGKSQTITLPNYNISASMGYAVAPQHYISVRANLNSQPPLSRYMFIADQNSNRIVDSPVSEKITSAALNYRYITPYVSLLVEGYIVSAQDITQVWQGYDDLSSTYCDIVISDIATRSIGVEISGELNLLRNLKLTSSLALGGYTYNSKPLVTLYDDVDMSLVSQSRASTLKGYVVGNAPQIVATASATYFAKRGFIVDADLSYYAKRFVAPSVTRRTNRVLTSATSVDLLKSMLVQESLPNIFNASVSLIKSLRLRSNERLSIVVKVDNILGRRDISPRDVKEIVCLVPAPMVSRTAIPHKPQHMNMPQGGVCIYQLNATSSFSIESLWSHLFS